jgi:hypothetical protein
VLDGEHGVSPPLQTWKVVVQSNRMHATKMACLESKGLQASHSSPHVSNANAIDGSARAHPKHTETMQQRPCRFCATHLTTRRTGRNVPEISKLLLTFDEDGDVHLTSLPIWITYSKAAHCG